MSYFFEVLSSRIGFSRIGRILFSKKRRLYISTPNIIIPIKNTLMRQLNFIQEFEDHEIFTVSKEIFLKIGFIKEKFKDNGFLFMSNGTMNKFEEILLTNLNVFSEDNIISIIPFNIPTTSISKEFATAEIKNHLSNTKEILKNYSNLNFGISIKVFNYTELFSLYISLIKKYKNIKILNLIDIFDNFSNFRNVLKVVAQIKKELDNNLIIMASGRITSKKFPMLIYLGVDLINSSYLLHLSAENFYDSIEYLLPIYKVRYLPCSCVACKGNLKNLITNKYSSEKIDLLCLHNLITATNYMNKIKQYLTYEDYRIFVEKSSYDDNNLISILKILDKDYFNLIRYETPISQKNKKIKALGPSSYFRPDFREFRKKIIENFEPEPWTTLIILLPCSAKKPYSESKSHKIFHKVLRQFPEFPSFQELIITSPLGVIPRQLENIYPVNSYDISVTGDWNAEEIDIAAKMLVRILKKYDIKVPVLCYLNEEYIEVVKTAAKELENNIIYAEIHGKSTSDESLNSLKRLILEFKDRYPLPQDREGSNYLTRSWHRKFIKILDYQFGIGSGRKIITNGIKPVKMRKLANINLIDLKTKQKLGEFKPSTGQIYLTLTSLNRLYPLPSISDASYIVFNGESIQGNTLFRAGVLEYSKDLIPGNQVVIYNETKDSIIGTGTLLVGTNFLQHTQTGRIAKIIEKK